MLRNPIFKKVGKWRMILIVLSFVFALTNISTIKAAEFELGPVPTAREVSTEPIPVSQVASVNSANGFVLAYANTDIKKIVLTGDITFTMTHILTLSNYTLTRSLVIDGGSHRLYFGVFPPSNESVFKLSLSPSDVTFHLKDLVIVQTEGDNNDNSLIREAGANWHIILEDISSSGDYQWKTIGTTSSDVPLFFRGDNGPFLLTDEFWNGSGDIVFEEGSTFNSPDKPNNGVSPIFYDSNTTTPNAVYFAPDSVVNIVGADGGPIFSGQTNFNVYGKAKVHLTKVQDAKGVQNSADVNQVYRIDGGAEFILENSNGPAFHDNSNEVSILTNPGASIEFIGNFKQFIYSGAVVFRNPASKLILNEPEYYNLRNNANSYAFHSASVSTPTLQIKNSDLGAWKIGAELDEVPTAPSPFASIDLNSGMNVLLAGSSAILNTMDKDNGWSTNKYSRIALSTPPTLSADDQSVGVDRKVAIDPEFGPVNASVTYTSDDTEIATVDADGVITGVKVGKTTITITVTNPEGVSDSIDITVKVTDDSPILTVPAFTEIKVGGSFDPMEGVSASDTEDGDLSEDIEIVSNEVDTNKAGLYIIKYRVVDSHGNEARAQRVVLVNDGNYVVEKDYIIHAKDFSVKESQVDISDEAIIKAAEVRVYRVATGEKIADPNLEIDKGGYTNKAGVYEITFIYNPSITIEATVIGEDKDKDKNETIKLPDTGNDTMGLFALAGLANIGMGALAVTSRREL